MTKNELINKLSDIQSKLEDLAMDSDRLKDGLNDLLRDVENLPTEPDEITDDEGDK